MDGIVRLVKQHQLRNIGLGQHHRTGLGQTPDPFAIGGLRAALQVRQAQRCIRALQMKAVLDGAGQSMQWALRPLIGETDVQQPRCFAVRAKFSNVNAFRLGSRASSR